MPLQAFRAARVLPSSQEDLIFDGGIVVDTDSGTISAVGPWDTLQDSITQECSIEYLGDVTLMPGLPVINTLVHYSGN